MSAQETTPARMITAERAGRLYRLLSLLGEGSQTRSDLLAALDLDIRAFYRDLEVLRAYGAKLAMEAHRYVLKEPLDDALSRVPFPDPGLNLFEAMQLAEGTAPAHKKLRAKIESFIGKRMKKPKK